jgi:cold shock CspA family protein
MRGHVNRIFKEQGYGVIWPEENICAAGDGYRKCRAVFFYTSNVWVRDKDKIEAGSLVEYEIIEASKPNKPKAKNIRVV